MSLLVALLVAAAPLVAQKEPSQPRAASARIDVVAAAPVDAAGLARNRIPANVTSVTRALATSSAVALAASGASIQFNDAQHNPL